MWFRPFSYVLGVAAESVGPDGWSYVPEAAPDGQQRAAEGAHTSTRPNG